VRNQGYFFPDFERKRLLYKKLSVMITVIYLFFCALTNWLRICNRRGVCGTLPRSKEIHMKLAQVLLASSMLFASANVFASEDAHKEAAPAAAEAAPAAAEAAAPAAADAKTEADCKKAHGKWDKKKHVCAEGKKAHK
jgi:hypothetical protein